MTSAGEGPVTSVSDLDMPQRVLEMLRGQGIEELYPPQAEAMGPVLEGRNLVLAIPTASGKTLVALLGVLKRVLAGGRALYIVPLKALAEEKYQDFSAFESLGIKVGVSIGDYDDLGRELSKCDVVIATSEKADSLSRHDLSWIERLSVVVADEVHLMHDPSRGPTLEVLLSRIRTLNPRCQMIALSATIQNSAEIAEWLDAVHVTSDFRPVVLKEGVFLDGDVLYTDDSKETFEVLDDPVVSVVAASAARGEQSLVFVHTRRSTESVAERLGALVGKNLPEGELEALRGVAGALRRADSEATSVADRLSGCISMGVAFHHAGLSPAQRRAVEEAFKSRRLRAIVATPTLAAGINLPAKRVVVRDVRRYDSMYGNLPIPVLEIKQMLGRAGRPRYDTEGQAILVAKTEGQRADLMERYLLGEPERIYSKLGTEAALRCHVLASIATGIVADDGDLERFVDSTFYSHQAEAWTIEERLERAVGFLEEEELITRKGGKLWPTRFGKRVSDLYVDPLSAVLIRQAVELADGMEEVTPLAWLTALASTPDLPTFFLRRTDYRTVYEYAQQHRDEFLVHDIDEELEREDFLAEVKTAMMFEDWVLELSEDGISVKYGIGPGDIRAKVDAGRWLAYAAREVARLFDHRDLARRLRALERRISYGVREELLPLVALRGVGRKRARALYAKGHRRVQDLREATVEELAAIPGIGPRMAASIVEQAAEGRRGRDYSGTTFEAENGVQEEGAGGNERAAAEEASGAEGEEDGPPEQAAAQMSLASFGGDGGGEGDG